MTDTQNHLIAAFDAPGHFFKGNLHCHSTGSDGALDPEEVCRRYRERGYDFLCLSDHFWKDYGFPVTDTTGFRTNRFTTILGAEVHTPAMSTGDLWHILAVGLPDDFAPTPAGETGPALAQRCRDAGAFVAIAHPQWHGLTTEDAEAIGSAHAIEVYNHASSVGSTRGEGSYMLDLLLNQGRRIDALACDDAHFAFPGDQNRDAFGGWVMVKAESNQPELLLEALTAGRSYSTQGPLIEDVHIEENELVVRCAQPSEIIVLGYGYLSQRVPGTGHLAGRVALDAFKDGWLRLVVRDSAGRCAWTNPMWNVPEGAKLVANSF